MRGTVDPEPGNVGGARGEISTLKRSMSIMMTMKEMIAKKRAKMPGPEKRPPLLEQPILNQQGRLVAEAQEDGEDDQAEDQKDSSQVLADEARASG